MTPTDLIRVQDIDLYSIVTDTIEQIGLVKQINKLQE